jgi:hypothetical protein
MMDFYFFFKLPYLDNRSSVSANYSTKIPKLFYFPCVTDGPVAKFGEKRKEKKALEALFDTPGASIT